MSIDTLLEAAKFVECLDQIRRQAAASTSAHNDAQISQSYTTKAICPAGGASFPVVYSSPSSSPGSHTSLSPRVSYSKQNVSTSNTDTFDEGDDKKSGTREVHNKLEKNRRAHLKDCFDNLRNQVPSMGDKKLKPSNLSILQGALRYLQALKRKERELEYETERLARQKIQYQERLAKLSGCPLPPWKKENPEIKLEEEGVEGEGGAEMEMEEVEQEDDRDSVSTSTSTASEAEEEERKSRAQSPEVRMGESIQKNDYPESSSLAPKPDVLPDHVIKVTQSVKEQSGPFLISRQIVTHLPVPTVTSADAQGIAIPVTVKAVEQQQKQHGTKADTENATYIKEFATSLVQDTARATSQVAATQNIAARPQSPAPQGATQQGTASKLGRPKQTSSKPTQAKITSNIERQIDSHTSALSAVQEHLKNKAQNRLPQQWKLPSRTNLHTMVASEPAVQTKSSMGSVTASTVAVSTAASTPGVTRQTVSQLLGKQSMVARQPVRRSDSKVFIKHPFNPRLQMKDIVPKSPVGMETIVMSHGAKPLALVTSKESVSSVPSKTASKKGVNVTSVNKRGIQSVPVSTQPITAPSRIDVQNLMGHNVMLPSIPHYPAGLATAMLRPSLTNPSVLTAANVALLSQAMLASSRNVAPHLMNAEGKTGTQAKPRTGSLPLVSHAVTQPMKASSTSQAKLQTLSYTTPITGGHQFLSPVPIQPALTQVLFTQPPIAAYTIAPSLVKTTLSPQPVIRHSILGPSAGNISQVATTVMGTNPNISHMTSTAIPVPPVVTIGAVSFNPLLNTNRALVTAPTLPTTLSFSQYSQYRFPFAGQVPVISPVSFTSSAAVPVTESGKATNGVVVHSVVPAALPDTSAWLGTTSMSNGIPAKDLTRPTPTQLTSVYAPTTQPTLAPSVTTSVATVSDKTVTTSSVTTVTSC